MEDQNNRGGIKSINVVLEYRDASGRQIDFDLNQNGLQNLTFNRYLGNTADHSSGVLSNIDLTMFDKSGSKLLGIFQANGGKLKLKYGFEDNMSEPYDLTILKYNSTFNNLGAMASIGAIGTEAYNKYGPEVYKADILVEDVLIRMAKRNGWDIGEPYRSGDRERYPNIDVGDLTLPWPLHLETNESDAQFIYNKILPLCKRTVVSSSKTETEFWDVTIFNNPSGKKEFYFRKYSDKQTKRRVWRYRYGVGPSSNVLSFTNKIDYTFLIRGLSIQLPASGAEYLATDDETLTDYYTDIVVDKWEVIQQMFDDNNLPIPKIDEFALKIEFTEMEESDESSIEIRIFDEIRKAITAINVIELEVIGNHRIRPIDIIDFQAMNRDGYNNIVTGLWKIVKITETIGQGGYTTRLGLVRQTTDITILP